MPLMRDNTFVEDTFHRVGDEEDLPASGAFILSLKRFESAGGAEGIAAKDATIGLDVPNTLKPDSIMRYFNRLSLISIAFPAFNDGRGFSIARRLRRLGFTGTLRAKGPLIADQYSHAKACGFDEIEVPEQLADRQGVDQWTRGGAAISLAYQRGYHRPTTILDRRRAAH